MTFISATNKLLRHAQARVLLVGSGRMGHIRAKAIYSNPRFEFCGVVDSNVEEAAKLGGIYRAPHYQSLAEAIDHSSSDSGGRPPLDGIVISTPTPTHEPLVAEAAYNGLSTFTEKPVDETADKIRSLFNTTRRHKVNLCCGFQRRFDPSYLSLYRQVNSGAIGTPLTANVFFGDHPVPSRSFLLQGGGNIISDCSAHDMDYIRWVLQDEVESVYATGTSSDDELRERGVIDNATMVMKFARGTVVTLTLSRGASYGYDQRCEVFGTQGLAAVRNQHESSNELADDVGVHRPKWQHSFPQRFETAFVNELDAYADTLLLGTPWPVTEDDCVAVQGVCDAALESCETGEVVHLERETDAVAPSFVSQ
eukprot:CAMPEP_0172580250 /NCGR_PEP_ID=MMETSP1067-20121228/139662_1 /TAXON_ID=265564 ORGANISM="Thalassiosira punctigera, Strain Tpunct2005C2" /NCGR_SAMPLE_ID=MMETSP1067 /ASSEMBLY_ACC=CAM_ASM_000444 /LENGTH=365 /DNA_ID=CAMNT_0013372987 /DNA_START=195 /DNA_END=1292 /DNA_ORIENTATION=+